MKCGRHGDVVIPVKSYAERAEKKINTMK